VTFPLHKISHNAEDEIKSGRLNSPAEWSKMEEPIVAIASEGNHFRKVLVWAYVITRVIRETRDFEFFPAVKESVTIKCLANVQV
jgi:hypothetical protein